MSKFKFDIEGSIDTYIDFKLVKLRGWLFKEICKDSKDSIKSINFEGARQTSYDFFLVG